MSSPNFQLEQCYSETIKQLAISLDDKNIINKIKKKNNSKKKNVKQGVARLAEPTSWWHQPPS